ncbi:MAG: DUF3137 domain-containing protein [Rickettsiales bacterium]|nr:DUF3137 domain-containing protein [Rickettsiales bacterium]
MGQHLKLRFIDLLRGKGLEPYAGDVTFPEVEGLEKPFVPYYDTHLRPLITTYEEKRIAALKKMRMRCIPGIPVMLLIFFLGIHFILKISGGQEEDPRVVLGMLTVALMTGVYGWMYAPVLRYSSSVKEKIYPLIIRFFGGSFAFHPEPPVVISECMPFQLLPKYDRSKMEDYVRGIYRGVVIECFELELSKYSRFEREENTVFNGVVIRLSANKTFNGKTVVHAPGGELRVNDISGMERVYLEDPEFEKYFNVYSTDQIEARYLLTVSFMERLKELGRLFGGGRPSCSFFENQLMIVIYTHKNLFKTGSAFVPATFTEEIAIVLQEMQTLFGIITTLKLDEKTGL